MRKVTQKQIDKLQRLARKACEARDKFEREFYRLEETLGWREACEEQGIAPNTNPGDWMC